MLIGVGNENVLIRPAIYGISRRQSCTIQINADTSAAKQNCEVVGSQPTLRPAAILKIVKHTVDSTGNRQLLHTGIFFAKHSIILKHPAVITVSA